MDKVERSSIICALCAKSTTENNKSLEGEGKGGHGMNILQRFNYEFNLLLTANLANNWSLCERCLPDVHSALQSKENVDKVECQVRRLQVEILKLLKNLAIETGRMYKDLRKIQQIVGRRPAVKQRLEQTNARTSSVKMQMEDKELIGIFKEKISYVVRDLEEFTNSTLNKVLNNVEPSIKVEPQSDTGDKGTDNGANDMLRLDIKFDEPIIPDNSSTYSPAVSEDDCELTQQNAIPIQRQSTRIQRKSREKPKVKHSTKRMTRHVSRTEEWNSPISTSDDDDNQVESSDDDFDPQDEDQTLTESKLSVFRRRLIKRIRQAQTISTSKNLPPEETDPRRPYVIKYIRSTKKFYVENFEFTVIDSLKALQCVACNFTIDSQKQKGKSLKVEDVIFDHILGKHLRLYKCTQCDNYFDLFAYLKPHYKMVHQRAAIIGRKYVCEICDKPLSNSYNLREHRWTHLNAEEKKDPDNQLFRPKTLILKEKKRHECNICGHVAKSNATLKMHKNKHLKREERQDEKAVCSLCGLEMLKLSLASHEKRCNEQLKKMEEKFIKCVVCGTNCKSRKELDRHRESEHPNEKVHQCKTCGKWFRHRSSLYLHHLTHRTERKKVCDKCGASYKTNGHLKRHWRNSCCGKDDKNQLN